MRLVLASALALLAAPALAQQGATQIEAEGRALINQWIEAFNRGDAETLARDVYLDTDKSTLTKTFVDLQAESFGKLEAYSAAFCGSSATQGKAILKFARIYTFGGKMADDEAKVFDLTRTDAGWRIANETDTPYATVLDCG